MALSLKDPNSFLEKTKSAYLTFKKNIQDKSSEELAENFIALLFETIMIGKATGIASCKMQQLRFNIRLAYIKKLP